MDITVDTMAGITNRRYVSFSILSHFVSVDVKRKESFTQRKARVYLIMPALDLSSSPVVAFT